MNCGALIGTLTSMFGQACQRHEGGQIGWGAGLKRSTAHRDRQRCLTIGAIEGQQRFNVLVHACVLQ